MLRLHLSLYHLCLYWSQTYKIVLILILRLWENWESKAFSQLLAAHKFYSVSWYLECFWASCWRGEIMDRFASSRPAPVKHLIWLRIPSPQWVSNKRLISFEYDFTYVGSSKNSVIKLKAGFQSICIKSTSYFS